jgi:DNA-binding NarL/FixJ family response regulator
MRVLLADDRTQVRSALRVLLEQRLGLDIVGEAAETERMFALVQAATPDLVLLDWELPGLGSNGALSAMRRACPALSIIALSGRPEARRAALDAGVDAFVSKGDPPDRLLAAIDRFA